MSSFDQISSVPDANIELGEPMSLADAAIALQSYKEVDERMEQLWRNIDGAVISRRMNPKEPSLCVQTAEDTLLLSGQSNSSVDALLSDLEVALKFLAAKLPTGLLSSLSGFLMADLVPRLIEQWLEPAVPSSLQNMQEFHAMSERAKGFHSTVHELGYTGMEQLQQWVEQAPTVWLGKCRETALDSIRLKLTSGLGSTRQVEKIERHMVTASEGRELATTGAGAAAETNDWGDDWGDAWDENQETEPAPPKQSRPKQEQPQPEHEQGGDDGADAWGWDENEAPNEKRDDKPDKNDDDAADAWGWDEGDAVSDHEAANEPETREAPHAKATRVPQTETRELVLKETYHISALPDQVMELLFAVLEDGAALTGDTPEYQSVASTAAGIFGLPILALALFRAVSPYYYSLEVGGTM